VKKAIREIRDQGVHKVLKVIRAIPDPRALKDHRVFRVHRVYPAFRLHFEPSP
jgi:hypothetical protein